MGTVATIQFAYRCARALYYAIGVTTFFLANEVISLVEPLATLTFVLPLLATLIFAGVALYVEGALFRRHRNSARYDTLGEQQGFLHGWWTLCLGICMAVVGAVCWLSTERLCDDLVFFRFFPGHVIWHLAMSSGLMHALAYLLLLQAEKFHRKCSISGGWASWRSERSSWQDDSRWRCRARGDGIRCVSWISWAASGLLPTVTYEYVMKMPHPPAEQRQGGGATHGATSTAAVLGAPSPSATAAAASSDSVRIRV